MLAGRERLLLKVFVLPPAGKPNSRNPWAWIPTLYVAEGIPYALISVVSVAVYTDLNASNTATAFYTSLFGLPWALKPLWSPIVDLLQTRRRWIWVMQLIAAAALAAVALALPSGHFLFWTAPLFLLLAIGSASHDIAADGFYMLANSEGQQSFFSGVRNTCYRLAALSVGGLLVLAGIIQSRTGNVVWSWQAGLTLAASALAALGLYHRFILPRPERDSPGNAGPNFFHEFVRTLDDFLEKPGIGRMVFFLLTFRLGEAQMLKLVIPFLRHARIHGGLALTTTQVGKVYAIVGPCALLAGGILGGILVSRRGLRAWLWPMVIIMHAPDLVFVFLSATQPHNLALIGSSLALEQFGYGFGFSAFMLYMIYIARGKHPTAHYAICTGIMALGMALPGMWSGWLQEKMGYPGFFVWVLISTIPSFVATALIPLERDFGKRATVG